MVVTGQNSDLPKKNQFGEEYPRSDQIQVVMSILFLIVWVLDSYWLKASTYPAAFVPLLLRLLIAGVILFTGLFLVKKSHDLVIDDIYDEPKLIDSGVYSTVRHPMYLGVLLIYLGLSSATLSVVSICLWLSIFAVYDKMAAYEEQDLIRIFDGDYIDYKRRVPRWIPKIF